MGKSLKVPKQSGCWVLSFIKLPMGPNRFYIKQEPDKMCKTELNQIRAAQLCGSGKIKAKFSCSYANKLLSSFQAK